ncbi:hypothetical protein TNCV_1901771 [Trichonephila clavipes]|nr:hypothetical protein TNCV_1901771 [Trichonephila clavipes]
MCKDKIAENIIAHTMYGQTGGGQFSVARTVLGITGYLLGQFIGHVIKVKVYMGEDPLEMYVILGGTSLHIINDIQANSVTDASPIA